MVDTRQRIIEATYACVARWGLAKTTVEDAAREANVSRATVYRNFPGGRDELIHAVVAWEFLAFFLRLYEEVQGAASLEEVMERGIMLRPPVHRRARGAPAGHADRAGDAPARPSPSRATGSGRPSPSSCCPTSLEHGLADGVDLHQAADFLARMVLSYMASPGPVGPRRPGPGRASWSGTSCWPAWWWARDPGGQPRHGPDGRP